MNLYQNEYREYHESLEHQDPGSIDCTEIWTRAQTVIPGGVNSPVRAFGGVGGGTPVFMDRGKGPYLYDITGKKYVDYLLGFGPPILGHAHPEIGKALESALAKGLCFAAPTLLEVQMAETLKRLMPAIQQVRMCNSGTEATQSALRLARGYTGRPYIIKFEACYHGHADHLLVKGGSGLLTFGLPNSAGVLSDFTKYTLLAPYNDLAATAQLFQKYGSEIAAIIVEPIAGNMNCIPPLPNFLQGLRQLCDEYNSLLIFDEVITGFRVALGGASLLFNIKPDITCLGKIIGGGLPVGAFGGKTEIMSFLAPMGPVYQAGTLSGNPLTMTAGLATLKILEEGGSALYDNLHSSAEKLTQGLKQLGVDYGIPISTHCVGGMFGIFFTEESFIYNYDQVANCDQDHFKQFFHGMLKQGVYFAPSPYESAYLSIAHSDSVLNYTLESAKKVFSQWTTKPD